MLVNAGYSHVPLLQHREWACVIGCSSYQDFVTLRQLVCLAFHCHHLFCVVMSQCQNWISLSHCEIQRMPIDMQKPYSWIFDNNGCALKMSDRISTDIGIFFWTGLTSNLKLSANACTKLSESGTALLLHYVPNSVHWLHSPLLIWIPTSLPSTGDTELHNAHLQGTLSGCVLLPRSSNAWTSQCTSLTKMMPDSGVLLSAASWKALGQPVPSALDRHPCQTHL